MLLRKYGSKRSFKLSLTRLALLRTILLACVVGNDNSNSLCFWEMEATVGSHQWILRQD